MKSDLADGGCAASRVRKRWQILAPGHSASQYSRSTPRHWGLLTWQKKTSTTCSRTWRCFRTSVQGMTERKPREQVEAFVTCGRTVSWQNPDGDAEKRSGRLLNGHVECSSSGWSSDRLVKGKKIQEPKRNVIKFNSGILVSAIGSTFASVARLGTVFIEEVKPCSARVAADVLCLRQRQMEPRSGAWARQRQLTSTKHGKGDGQGNQRGCQCLRERDSTNISSRTRSVHERCFTA